MVDLSEFDDRMRRISELESRVAAIFSNRPPGWRMSEAALVNRLKNTGYQEFTAAELKTMCRKAAENLAIDMVVDIDKRYRLLVDESGVGKAAPQMVWYCPLCDDDTDDGEK
jgi:hypothetical protein